VILPHKIGHKAKLFLTPLFSYTVLKLNLLFLNGNIERTLARHFRLETGMTFGQWRQQIRILEDFKHIVMKEAVTTVAIDLGYDSPSAFISMFKKALGKTPGRYFAE
jgi:AraC-like DNA-binding protein